MAKSETEGPDPVRAALLEFIGDVNAAGGLVRSSNGDVAPVGDPSWLDLGSTYLRACEAAGRDPIINEEDE